MVSPGKVTKGHEVELGKFTKNRSFRRKRKLSTILKSKKIFLYIKNHLLLSKYEAQLKSFGANIVPFLDKDVQYVLTDLPGCNGKSSHVADSGSILSPTCYSVSPATSVSGDECVSKKSRTRAEAMLERVPVQTQSVSAVNPISNAISWNIPVYSLDFFQNWLDKKLSQVQLINDHLEVKAEGNVKIFEKRYLKLEGVVKNKYRPEFKEVSRWPTIYTDALAGSCPFDKKNTKRSGRKEKNHADKKEGSDRMNRTCNKVTNEAGYCEICAVHYKDLSQHVTESTHLKFACNDKNYADLDNCIKTRSVEAFLAAHHSSSTNSYSKDTNNTEDMGRNLRKSVSLHLNNNENSAVTRAISNSKLLDESLKQPLQVQCNGFTNYHLRKSAIKSDSVLMKTANCYETKDLLRETRKIYGSCPDNNLSAKDLSHLSPVEDDSIHRLRSRRNLILPSILIGTTAEDANKNRIVPSPQTPTSNHFLRSSASPRSCHYATRSKLPAEENGKKLTSPSKEPRLASGVHFTRSKLSNGSPPEPKGSRSSVSPKDDNHARGKRKPSGISDEDERQMALVFPRNVPSYQSNKKLKVTLCNDLDACSNELCNNAEKNHRKRLSAEEKFLEDNKEYYKVEMLRTKLRSTEFYCNREISQTVPQKEELKQETTTQGMDGDSEAVVMRFRKMSKRTSALHLLNLEAENFMFGPPKTSKDEDDSDEEKEESNENEDSAAIVNGDLPEDDTARTNSEACGSENKQNARRVKGKKRRTHAELFIHDNLDYYKFEISDSRLRNHQDNGDASVKNEFCDRKNSISVVLPDVKIKEEIFTDDESEPLATMRRRCKNRRKELALPDSVDETIQPKEEQIEGEHNVASECCVRPAPPESITFSFESAPCKEPWYRTFQRFDTCDEQYIFIPNSVYFNRYRDVRPSMSVRKTAEKQQLALAAAAASKDNNLLAHFRRKHRPKLGRFVIDDKPRKSPRCHASTLAILSSITGNRRRSRKLHPKVTTTASVVAKPDLTSKPVSSEMGHEHQVRLKETAYTLAKEIDDYFIDVFSRENSEDKYFSGMLCDSKGTKTSSPSRRATNAEDRIDWQQCLQVDESILGDRELLQCFSDDVETIGDMASFMESSQRCNSIEVALEEESAGPRYHDSLSRLCRENDYSCNSSDCGASSTCEFLGFAEDGRTVSRKRKRKRPNMTGWPHDRAKRNKQIRFLERSRNGKEAAARKAEPANNETVSEADSECTDDDLPLTEIVNRKKKRPNPVADEPASKDESNAECSSRSSRRSSKSASSTLLVGRRLSTPRRNSKYSISYSRRHR